MLMTKIDVYCVTCGEDGQADATTGKCVRCGRQAIKVPATQDSLAREKFPTGAAAVPTNGHSVQPVGRPASPPPPERVQLPNTVAARRWQEQTRQLAEGFAQAAKEARRKASAAEAEAVRLERAAARLEAVLDSTESAPTAGTSGWSGRSMVKVDACIDCGSSSVKHIANGRCGHCDSAWRARGRVT